MTYLPRKEKSEHYKTVVFTAKENPGVVPIGVFFVSGPQKTEGEAGLPIPHPDPQKITNET